MIWTTVFILGLITVIWRLWRYKNKHLLDIARKIPGPPALPGLGNALLFMCQPEEFVRVIGDLIRVYGDVLGVWLGPNYNIVLTNPDDLKILLSNPKTSFKGPQYQFMAEIIGSGILSGSGPTWRKHRKIATPNYGKKAIESYSNIFNNEVDLLLQRYRKKTGQIFDIYEDIVQTTSYCVCRTLMGLTKEETMNLPHLQDIIAETPKIYDLVFDRITKWYLQVYAVFRLSKNYGTQKNFTTKIKIFSKTVLQHRQEHMKTLEVENKIDLMTSEDDNVKNTQLSVIDRFILSKELDGEELLNETFTIFTSSQEASAKITSFLLLMMAFHPDCQDKLYYEIKTVIGDEDRPVTNEDLKQMPYLDMAFKEVLRLFPIGAMLQRSIHEDMALSTSILPGGSSVVIPIYHLHRDPRFWDNPDDFDPERFNPENINKRHPYCYIPFSLGSMDCLGRYFGTKLIKTICVRVLREFKITTMQSYEDLKVAIAISTVAIDGYPAKLTRRI
ncbi:cytochrome P450 4c3-like [Hyposmocoma kahamanoa]|uniref:cytochrome P450 4c3-like n=1 Tax=Hyposmocoma kahamanoa TaxID=1477025 RepID=UPI000E6D6BA3|nr:cytochrome P450 4c3-like [Hyposmocoma kahamanoa]